MLRRAAGVLLVLTGVLSGTAQGAEVRPGPPLMYAPAHVSPLLAPTRAFPARPLLVSGTDAVRHGEYLYQDYLYDDHGADSLPGPGASAGWASQPVFAPAAGDLTYPPGARYRYDAADLVEFRLRPTRAGVTFRVTLNTAVARDTTVVGIGIDTDRTVDTPVAWPHGAGVSTPGLDEFVTAWGTGGDVTRMARGATTALPRGAVRMDLRRNQMTISAPRRLLGRGRGTWRLVAGTGLWDAEHRTWEPGRPLNLAFRFHEPVGSVHGTGAGLPGYTTEPGTGSWFEDGQARELAAGTTGADHADVDLNRLAAGRSRWLHAPGRVQARVLSSRLPIPEGVDHAAFPEFGGELQPYLVTLPPDYDPRRRTPVLFALHPSNSGYQAFDVFMPHWAEQLGAHRLVVTPLDRGLNGPDGATGQFTGAAEANFFEVLADLRHRFRIDLRRMVLAGYSLGAYADYHLAELWPDLFAGVFSVVGAAPTNGRDPELEANLRWIPVLAWNQADDALVPYTDAHATAAALDHLGLRHEQWTFPAGNHLAPALRDDWAPAARVLGDPILVRDPPRIDFGYYPSLDDRRLRLVHDHAYWISQLRLAHPQKPDAVHARGDVSARSLAFGRGDPPARTYTGTGSAGGSPAAVEGVRWGATPRTPARNELDLTLTDLAHARIDARRAGLTRTRALTIRTTSDNPATVTLAFGSGAATLHIPAGRTVHKLPARHR